MADAHHKKQQTTAALTQVRMELHNEVSHLRRALDMKQHFLGSIKIYPWEWVSCFAIFGWLLSRVPARKKRIYIDSSTQKPIKAPKAGLLSTLPREFWKFSKPIIATYLAKLLAEKAQGSKAVD